ncbi:MAG: hypothetical protein AAF667_19525 [Pseudomonadota bacterium]
MIDAPSRPILSDFRHSFPSSTNALEPDFRHIRNVFEQSCNDRQSGVGGIEIELLTEGDTVDTTMFTGKDGLLVFEAESAKTEGYWTKTNVDGERVMLWNAPKSNYGKVDEDETLSYDFTTDESGRYSFALHSGRVKSVMNGSDRYHNGVDGAERTDTGNDAYVGVVDVETGEYIKEPTKLYTGLGSADRDLKWGTTFEDSSGHYSATVDLEAGKEYRLEVTGRSDGYALDRITLNKGTALRDDEVAESVKSSPTPEDPAAADPTYVAAQEESIEPVEEDDGDDSMFSSFFGFFDGFFDSIASLFGGGNDDDEAVAETTQDDPGPTERVTVADTLSWVLPVTEILDDTMPTGDDEEEEEFVV